MEITARDVATIETCKKSIRILRFFGFINAGIAVVILIDILIFLFGNCLGGGCSVGMGLFLALPSLINVVISGIILAVNWRDFKKLPKELRDSMEGRKVNSDHKLTLLLLLSPIIVTAGYFLIAAIVTGIGRNL